MSRSEEFNSGAGKDTRLQRGTASICPRCKNVVATRITDSGVTMATHRVSRTSSEVCR